MRLAYLGTSEFAATVLGRLAASPHRPALVITPPDRKQGRGRRVAPPPVARVAADLGLELHQTASVNQPESLQAVRGAGIQVGLVCAFGQLIKTPLLDEVEMLNIHPSLLPRWRGAAPIERAIMAGDRETGVAIMRLTEGLDSGPVALSERIEIDPGENFRIASRGVSPRSVEIWRCARSSCGTRTGSSSPSKATKVSPTRRRSRRSDRELDPARGAAELANVTRALDPHIGAYLRLEGGDRLGVIRAEAMPGGPVSGALESGGEGLVLGTADGGLRVLVVKPAGKREMPVADYLRGNPAPRLAS